MYGSDASAVRELMAGGKERGARLGERLHGALPYTGAEVVWAVRQEMARTVEDVLARRTRALFLNARAAIEMAPAVAALMAAELERGEAWSAAQVRVFGEVAKNYFLQ